MSGLFQVNTTLPSLGGSHPFPSLLAEGCSANIGTGIGSSKRRERELKTEPKEVEIFLKEPDWGASKSLDFPKPANQHRSAEQDAMFSPLACTRLGETAKKNAKSKVTERPEESKETVSEKIEHGLIEKIEHSPQHLAAHEILDYESQIGDEQYEQEETLQRIKLEKEVEHVYYRNHLHRNEHLKTIEHNHYVDHVKNIDHIRKIEKVFQVTHKHVIEDRHIEENVHNMEVVNNYYHRDVDVNRVLVAEDGFGFGQVLGESVSGLGTFEGVSNPAGDGVFEIWEEQIYVVKSSDLKFLLGGRKGDGKRSGNCPGLSFGKSPRVVGEKENVRGKAIDRKGDTSSSGISADETDTLSYVPSSLRGKNFAYLGFGNPASADLAGGSHSLGLE